MTIKRRRLLPGWIPQWFHRRAEVDTIVLYDFLEAASVAIPQGSRLLDAGAGESQYRALFQQTRYIGVDLAIGDSSWNYQRLDARCDLSRLPFVSQAFDVVLCTQVLEHVVQPQQVLAELSRALRPGGTLYLSAPQSWHQHQTPHDYYRFTSYGLRYLLEQAGFEVESLRPMGGYFWFLAFQLQNVNYWLFPRGMPHRWLTWPLRALNGIVFQLLCSLALYYMDRFDKAKDETFGYVGIAKVPKAIR
jgi:SAM-dependent methyltransferase